MIFQFRHAAAAFAVLAATGTAGAQTVITTRPSATETVIQREPLQLTPMQRTTIYRTIIPRSHGRKPIVKERVVTEPVAPPVRERVVVPAPPATVGLGERVVVPPPAYVGTPDDYAYVEEPAYVRPRVAPAATYAVGSRAPASARLTPLPRALVAREPTLRPYRYMVFRDRVLLVDPATSTIVADVTDVTR